MRVISIIIFAFISLNLTAYADNQAPLTPSETIKYPTEEEFLDSITPTETSPLEDKVLNQKKYSNLPNFITLHDINYLLPYYHTQSPYKAVYEGNTPEQQSVMQTEFKGQFSVEVPIIHDLSLNASYTQLVFWQVYAHSQYFRETNYEPTIYVNYHLYRNWLLSAGFDHQSNGRGGEYERSWNRMIGSAQFSGKHWFTKLDVWGLVAQGESSDLHNPDIEKYLGHERITLGYKIADFVVALEVQNIEGGFERGSIIASASYPIANQINLYTQYFNGYGQSLIEYNHPTQGFGVGISFNNWL
ncbi:MAG: phospholipase A [Bdellovibrionota bacterium]